MAATWDRDLIHRIASAIGDEGRAKYHEALRRQGFTEQYQGLTFWSPKVNIFRDPRWGPGQETWREDPYLSGEMGSAFVRGLQGDHPRYLKAPKRRLQARNSRRWIYRWWLCPGLHSAQPSPALVE